MLFKGLALSTALLATSTFVVEGNNVFSVKLTKRTDAEMVSEFLQRERDALMSLLEGSKQQESDDKE